jgi:hypothetical protein
MVVVLGIVIVENLWWNFLQLSIAEPHFIYVCTEKHAVQQYIKTYPHTHKIASAHHDVKRGYSVVWTVLATVCVFSADFHTGSSHSYQKYFMWQKRRGTITPSLSQVRRHGSSGTLELGGSYTRHTSVEIYFRRNLYWTANCLIVGELN